MKRILCLGAAGFICGNLVTRLKKQGHYVMAVDIDLSKYGCDADVFLQRDLTDIATTDELANKYGEFDQVYQMGALMGGARFAFVGKYDADIIHNSAMINLNVCNAFKHTKSRIFFSSSACAYPERLQFVNGKMKEQDSWDGKPDSIYGVEKLFSEQVYDSFYRNYGLDIRIARFHNIAGERGHFKGGREKAPASFTRQVIEATDYVNIFGDGEQKRSFLYIEDCLDAVELLMESDWKEPINIGSEESISMNDFVKMIIEISGKKLRINHIPRTSEIGLGVHERNSDNELVEKILGWEPKYTLSQWLPKLYAWIESQIEKDAMMQNLCKLVGV